MGTCSSNTRPAPPSAPEKPSMPEKPNDLHPAQIGGSADKTLLVEPVPDSPKLHAPSTALAGQNGNTWTAVVEAGEVVPEVETEMVPKAAVSIVSAAPTSSAPTDEQESSEPPWGTLAVDRPSGVLPEAEALVPRCQADVDAQVAAETAEAARRIVSCEANELINQCRLAVEARSSPRACGGAAGGNLPTEQRRPKTACCE
mmetsp:Transcript_98618/g.247146  ORF Transcript_98618/g.247146 Transcript_98618/m.247146 type:complete len:201 (+) Transcript_98618:72-674(+)